MGECMKLTRGFVMAAAWAAFVMTNVAPASAQIQKMLVVARKVVEDIQKIPVAVTAFSGDQLVKQGVRDFTQLGQQTPSLAVVRNQGAASGVILSLRGQGAADLLLTVDPAVATYLDGVPLNHGYGMGSNIFDLERIEIVKGPQG